MIIFVVGENLKIVVEETYIVLPTTNYSSTNTSLYLCVEVPLLQDNSLSVRTFTPNNCSKIKVFWCINLKLFDVWCPRLHNTSLITIEYLLTNKEVVSCQYWIEYWEVFFSYDLTNCSQCVNSSWNFSSLEYIFETIFNISSSSTKLRNRSDDWE